MLKIEYWIGSTVSQDKLSSQKLDDKKFVYALLLDHRCEVTKTIYPAAVPMYLGKTKYCIFYSTTFIYNNTYE